MDLRQEIFVQVAASLFAAFRTDKHPTDVAEDVNRMITEAGPATDAILAAIATQPEVAPE